MNYYFFKNNLISLKLDKLNHLNIARCAVSESLTCYTLWLSTHDIYNIDTLNRISVEAIFIGIRTRGQALIKPPTESNVFALSLLHVNL
jgi:hypothetical protein